MGVVDDIRARLDIVSVVSEYVALQKAGRSFKAACPFHSERTPSFHVNPERQSWRCFGACATGGDIFSFVMRKENLEFGDALRLLAQKAGVELTAKSQEERDHNDTLYSINKEASRFYREALASPQGATARKYLDGRGVNAESRARFELGFSLDSWDALKNHLLLLGFKEDDVIAAGLLHKNEKGNVWDFFRGRLIFPIHDRQGRVAGFGARALDDSTPKYINTSQTPIFNKRDTLYAMHLAAGPIRTQNAAVIVEGYMDAIAAHEHGYNNVVASMGTALTEQQVAQLKSIAKNIILALDADAAGQQATQRDLDATWQAFQHQKVNQRSRVGDFYFREPFNLKVALISQGHDPDELIRQDANQWEQLIQEAIHFLDFRIPAITRQFDISTGQGKAQVVEKLFPMIASLDNQFDQERYFSKLAQTLGVTEEALKASVSRPRARSTRRGQSASGGADSARTPEISVSPLSSRPEDALEDYALALLLSRPDLKEAMSDFDAACLRNVENREVFTAWLNYNTMDALKESLDRSLHERLARLTQKEMPSTDRLESEKALRQCRQRLEQRHQKEIQESMLASEDANTPPPREIEAGIVAVNEKIRRLSLPLDSAG